MALTIQEPTGAVQVSSNASEVSSLVAAGHKSMTLLLSGVAMELFEEKVVLLLPAVALASITMGHIDVVREISCLNEVVIGHVAVAQEHTIHAPRSAVAALFNEGLVITLLAAAHRLSILAPSCAVVELFNVKMADIAQAAVAPGVMTEAPINAVMDKLCERSVIVHHVAALRVTTPVHTSVVVEMSYVGVVIVHGAVVLGATILAGISAVVVLLHAGVVTTLAAVVQGVMT